MGHVILVLFVLKVRQESHGLMVWSRSFIGGTMIVVSLPVPPCHASVCHRGSLLSILLTAECPASTRALSPPTCNYCPLPGNLPFLQGLFSWNPSLSPPAQRPRVLQPQWKRILETKMQGKFSPGTRILRTAWVEGNDCTRYQALTILRTKLESMGVNRVSCHCWNSEFHSSRDCV